MQLNSGHIALCVVCLVAGIIIGSLFKGCSKPVQPAEPIVIHDTISVTDTLRIQGKTKTISTRDTIWLTKTDTLLQTDTLKMLVYETKEYRDTFATDTSFIALGVRYSGYESKIDAVDLNYRFEVQPQIVEKKRGWRWAVTPSIQVGYGVAFGQPIIAAPYVGVGVSIGYGYTFKK